MKTQAGFTLIELVIVIVLLGVLSAIAVPRFVNLEDDAQRAQRNATAAAITSAMNINYAGCAVNSHNASSADCVEVDDCSDAVNVLSNGTSLIGPALSFTVIAGPITPDANGSTRACTLTQTATSATATFTAVQAGTI